MTHVEINSLTLKIRANLQLLGVKELLIIIVREVKVHCRTESNLTHSLGLEVGESFVLVQRTPPPLPACPVATCLEEVPLLAPVGQCGALLGERGGGG